MSRIMRCNRCGAEQEAELNFSFSKGGEVTGLDNWARVMVIHKSPQPEVMGRRDGFDLCEDCREILVEQFFKGAAVAPITQPLVQTILPHQPMTDCMLVWDPERGGFLCEHDDSERYHKLCRDQAQNCAEGVPPQDVQDAVERLVTDVHTAGYAHSYVQRCTPHCNEGHTYQPGCLLQHTSQHGEDLSAAYSPQDPPEEEGPYGHGDVDLGIPPQRGWSGDPDNG